MRCQMPCCFSALSYISIYHANWLSAICYCPISPHVKADDTPPEKIVACFSGVNHDAHCENFAEFALSPMQNFRSEKALKIREVELFRVWSGTEFPK